MNNSINAINVENISAESQKIEDKPYVTEGIMRKCERLVNDNSM